MHCLVLNRLSEVYDVLSIACLKPCSQRSRHVIHFTTQPTNNDVMWCFSVWSREAAANGDEATAKRKGLGARGVITAAIIFGLFLKAGAVLATVLLSTRI